MLTSLNLRKPPLDRVDSEFLRANDITLNVLRLDQIHPQVHGNKWYKLKYNIDHVLSAGIETVLSFGGAYSNHLAVLAATGRYAGIRTIGVVRGELVAPLNPVLAFAQAQGMVLTAISRTDYRRKTEPDFINQLQRRFGPFYLVPEGGSNALAVKGCEEIADHVRWQTQGKPRYLALACGTGTTMAGVIRGLAASAEPPPAVIGIAVLNATGYLQREVNNWLAAGASSTDGNVEHAPGLPSWSIVEDYHGGGYAKIPGELCEFMEDFAQFSTIPIEGVYTGKLFYGLFQQIRRGFIPRGSEIIALHTGGIHR